MTDCQTHLIAFKAFRWFFSSDDPFDLGSLEVDFPKQH